MPTYKVWYKEPPRPSQRAIYLRAGTIAEADNLVRELGEKIGRGKFVPFSIIEEEDTMVCTETEIREFKNK